MSVLYIFDPCEVIDREEWARVAVLDTTEIASSVKKSIAKMFLDEPPLIFASIFSLDDGLHSLMINNESQGSFAIDSGLVCLCRVCSDEGCPQLSESIHINVCDKPSKYVLNRDIKLRSFTILNDKEEKIVCDII